MQSMLVLVKESDSEGMAKILGSGQTKSVKLDQLLSTGARVVSSWVALGGLCLLVEGVFEVVERVCSPSRRQKAFLKIGRNPAALVQHIVRD